MTDFPAITALPTPPARGQDPAVFIQRADAIIDAIANTFIAQLNAFGPALSQAIQERVTNAAAVSYRDAANAASAAATARDQAQQYAASIDIRTGTTEGKVPVLGSGGLLDPARVPLLQTNPNIGPTYLDWSYGSFVFSNISYVSKYGASGWCLSLNGVANDVPVVSAPLRAYPKGVDLVVSFIGWTNQGNATITNDLYPDDLPETTVILGTTPQRFSFVANSTSANMDNASLRFFWVGSTPGTTAFITDVKVEYGTRPTAYTRNDAGPGQFRANTPDRLLTTSVVWNDVQAVPFNDAPSMTLNFSAVVNAYTTLTGNRTLANPVNPKSGQSGYIVFTQDATGGRTLAFGTGWRFGGQVPTMSTAANARDVLYYTILQDGSVDAYLAKSR